MPKPAKLCFGEAHIIGVFIHLAKTSSGVPVFEVSTITWLPAVPMGLVGSPAGPLPGGAAREAAGAVRMPLALGW